MRIILAALTFLAIFSGAWLLADPAREVYAQTPAKQPLHCTIDTVSAVDFGSYDPDDRRDETSSGRLVFTCHPSNRVTIQVNIGPSTVSGSIVDRRMRELGGNDELRYNLFQDRRGTVIWGDGHSGGSPAIITGSKTFRVDIFGVMPANQEVSSGIYADAVRITILP